MRLTGRDKRWILALALAGLLVPQSVFAREAAIADAALQDGGTLYGQLVDEEGIPQKAEQVVMRHQRQVVAVAKTDAQGRFAVRGLRAGVYEMEAAGDRQVYRLWAANTAPPTARPSVLLVSGDRVLRGQLLHHDHGHGDGNGHGGTMEKYGPAIRGAIAGGLLTGLAYWALDYNPDGS